MGRLGWPMATLWVLAACEPPAEKACPLDSEQAWLALKADLEAHMDEAGVTGAAVAIVESGKRCRSAGFGTTAVGGDVAVTKDTLFRWGSVAKMHTAAALLQLEGQGRLSLQDPVSDHVPYLQLDNPEVGVPTVYQLLTHTSGLPDDSCADGSTDPEALRAHFIDNSFRLQSPPGTLVNYSNRNYWLAGLVVEEVSGTPFADHIESSLLRPSGMEDATFDVHAAEDLPHALNVTFADTSAEPSFTHCARGAPSGMLYASVEDLARTIELHLAEGVDRSVGLAMREQVDTRFLPDSQERYGYGLWSYPYQEAEAYIHGGRHAGFRSVVGFVPEEDFGVALVSNDPDFDQYAMLDRALELYLGPFDGPWPPDYRTPSSEWGRYEGTYFEPDGLGTITVFLDGGRLYAETTETTRELVQVAGDRFSWPEPGQETDLVFWALFGEVEYMATRAWVAKRVSP